MSESPKPADALRTLPERAFRARARLVAGVFCLVCCGLAVRLLFLQVLGGGWYTETTTMMKVLRKAPMKTGSANSSA